MACSYKAAQLGQAIYGLHCNWARSPGYSKVRSRTWCGSRFLATVAQRMHLLKPTLKNVRCCKRATGPVVDFRAWSVAWPHRHLEEGQTAWSRRDTNRACMLLHLGVLCLPYRVTNSDLTLRASSHWP